MAERYARYAEDLCKGISSVQDGNLHADLFDCLRADARRFAAYKAHHVQQTMQRIEEDKTYREQEKAQAKQRAAHLFDLWQTTERGMAMASAQMADKWESFAEDGDAYYLQYRTARDEKVRAEHQVLDGTTLPMSDDFWKSYYPPLGWNCRCNVVQVHKDKHKPTNSTNACQAGEMITRKQPSFRFNPGIEKRCFPKTVSYYKHANAETRRVAKNIERQATIRKGKDLYNKRIAKELGDEHINIEFNATSISHFANDLLHDKKLWLKNELLTKIETIIQEAEYVAFEQNTKLSQKPTHDKYFYLKSKLADGTPIYLSIYRNKVTGRYLFYAVSKTLRETATPV